MALWASSRALASEIVTVRVVTSAYPAPIYTPTNPAAPSCTEEGAKVFFDRPVAHGELLTALREASITITGAPTLPCSAIAALPTAVHGDFASLETTWSDWWQTAR